MYVCMYAHHTDIHAPHQKASVATQPSFRHHSFGRVLHKLWLALLPATQASQASLSLHCAELSHRHLLSTHNASEPFPFALPQGLGVIAQRHRRPCARCLLWTQASPASLALHCAELTHRRLLSTHAEPFPSHCEKGLGVIAQRHRKSFPCPSTPPMHSCPSTSPSPPRQDKCCARWHQSRQRLSLRASTSFAHQRGRISRPQPQPQARPWPVRATRHSAQVGESRRSVAPAICRGCAYYRGACLVGL